MDLRRSLNFTGRRSLPVVLQNESAECGLACLAMVARRHGHDVDLNGLRQRLPLSLAGISLGQLMAIADRLQLPEGTVKSRINRGRHELARQITRLREKGLGPRADAGQAGRRSGV